jgi:hypothetical protein
MPAGLGAPAGRVLSCRRFSTAARIAGLSEVTISLEHLRGLDRARASWCGCELGDFTDTERARLPRDEGPADPARIIEGPFDPANPRRILRT